MAAPVSQACASWPTVSGRTPTIRRGCFAWWARAGGRDSGAVRMAGTSRRAFRTCGATLNVPGGAGGAWRASTSGGVKDEEVASRLLEGIRLGREEAEDTWRLLSGQSGGKSKRSAQRTESRGASGRPARKSSPRTVLVQGSTFEWSNELSFLLEERDQGATVTTIAAVTPSSGSHGGDASHQSRKRARRSARKAPEYADVWCQAPSEEELGNSVLQSEVYRIHAIDGSQLAGRPGDVRSGA